MMTLTPAQPKGQSRQVRVHVCRATSPSPLSLEGFLAREAKLVQALEKATTKPVQQLQETLLKSLQYEGLATSIGKDRLLRQVDSAFQRFASEVLALVPEIGAEHQANMAQAASKATQKAWFSNKRQLVQKALSAEEQLQQTFFLRSNALFMGAYLQDTLPEKAKYAVLEAFKDSEGLEYADKLENIRSTLTNKFAGLTEAPLSYWKTYACNALNNARTYAQLKLFEQQEGVVGYRIRAVIDSQTTNICRTLHGRTFPVQQALARYERMFQATSLSEIKAISPMVQGSSGDFRYDSAGTSIRVDAADSLALSLAGITFPPFHFNCRSTIEPVYGVLDYEAIEASDLPEEEKAILRQLDSIPDAESFAAEVAKLKSIEVLGAFGPDGEKRFLTTSFMAGEIDLNAYQLQELKDAVLVHNHPYESTLSNGDLVTAITGNASGVWAAYTREDGTEGISRMMRPVNQLNWHSLFRTAEDAASFDAMARFVAENEEAVFRLRHNWEGAEATLERLSAWADGDIMKERIAAEFFNRLTNPIIANQLGAHYE